MSKYYIASLIVVTTVLACNLGWAGKITVDPNTPGYKANNISWKDQLDQRLFQKITYDSGPKRLHGVLEDLARMSGVEIYCGRDRKDWNVRDIPLVVYVKDIPLGKLLRAITDATHTKFTSEKIGDDSIKSYRIYRRSKEKTEIDNFLRDKHEAELAEAKWVWNALAAYGNGNPIGDFYGRRIPKETWLIGKLIAATGPDSEELLLNGNTFRFSGGDPRFQNIINELYELELQHYANAMNNSGLPVNPPGTGTESAALEIRLRDSGESGWAGLSADFGPLQLDGSNSSSSFISMDSETSSMGVLSEYEDMGLLKDRAIGLPARPKGMCLPNRAYDLDNPTMIDLSKKEEMWDCPPFNTKVDLELPIDVKNIIFADLIRTVASATGCNIVVEDFVSHMDARYQRLDRLYRKQTSIAEIFRGMLINGQVGYSWFYNNDSNLIVGWADSVNTNWRQHHRNLISEEYLNYLRDKLDGLGVSFDDALLLLNLPQKASDTWIRCSNKLGCLGDACSFSDSSLWQLYGSLCPEDKLMAKSKDGLSLAKFDISWIADFFRSLKTRQISSYTLYSSEEEAQIAEGEKMRKEQAISDPQIISTMIMHVEEEPVDHRRVTSIISNTSTQLAMKEVPKALTLSRYAMVINYFVEGEEHQMYVPYSPQLVFPVRTPERESEIINGYQ